MSTPQIRAPLAGPNLSPLPVLTPDYANGQRISVTETHGVSAPVQSHVVILAADCDCFVAAGENPQATVGGTSFPIFAGQTIPIGITPGHMISVIRDSVSGHLSIMPVVEVA